MYSGVTNPLFKHVKVFKMLAFTYILIRVRSNCAKLISRLLVKLKVVKIWNKQTEKNNLNSNKVYHDNTYIL